MTRSAPGTLPPLILAPMAGHTHAAFRQLVAELGGCDLFFTEMLNSRIVCAKPVESDPYCRRAQGDSPCFAQVAGGEPQRVALSIARLEQLEFAGFDINMGCSRHTAMRRGWGLALMLDPDRAEQVVRAARKATRLPLSVKIRSGADHDPGRLVEFVRRLGDCGVDFVTLHPRSLKDGFKRPSRWSEISEVVSRSPVPVIGNGDVTDREEALRLWETTGCSGIMIGRAALIRPWLFWEIAHDRNWPGDPGEVIMRMADLTMKFSPPASRVRHFFLFCSWILRNWTFHHHLLARLRGMDSVEGLCDTLLAELRRLDCPMLPRPLAARL